MKTINRVEIQGSVGRDAVQKSEKAPIKFSIATGNDPKPDGSGKWPLVWHNITVWNNPEALGIKKGDYLHIVGRLNYTKWTAKDGTEKTGVEVVAYDIKSATPEEKPLTPNYHGVTVKDSDIPF